MLGSTYSALTDDEKTWVFILLDTALSEEQMIEKLTAKIKELGNNFDPIIHFNPPKERDYGDQSPETALMNIAAREGKLDVLKFLIRTFNNFPDREPASKSKRYKRYGEFDNFWKANNPLLYAIKEAREDVIEFFLNDPEASLLRNFIESNREFKHEIFLECVRGLSKKNFELLNKIIACGIIDPGHTDGSVKPQYQNYMSSFLYACSQIYPNLDQVERLKIEELIKNFIKNSSEITVVYQNNDDGLFYREDAFINKLMVQELQDFIRNEFESERKRRKNIQRSILEMEDTPTVYQAMVIVSSRNFLLQEYFTLNLNDSGIEKCKSMILKSQEILAQEIAMELLSADPKIGSDKIMEVINNLDDRYVFLILSTIRGAKKFEESSRVQEIFSYLYNSSSKVKISDFDADAKLSLDADDDDILNDDKNFEQYKSNVGAIPVRMAFRRYLIEKPFFVVNDDKSYERTAIAMQGESNADVKAYLRPEIEFKPVVHAGKPQKIVGSEMEAQAPPRSDGLKIFLLKSDVNKFILGCLKKNLDKEKFSKNYKEIISGFYSPGTIYFEEFTSEKNIDKIWNVLESAREGKFVGAIRHYVSEQVADFVDSIIRYINEKILGVESRENKIEKIRKSTEDILKPGK